jgi:phasin
MFCVLGKIYCTEHKLEEQTMSGLPDVKLGFEGDHPMAAPKQTIKNENSASSPADNLGSSASALLRPVPDVHATVRDFAEKGAQQAKKIYDKARTSAEEASDLMEESFATTSKGLKEFNLKTLDAVRSNANATFDLAQQLLGAKSVSQAIEIQTAYARRQFETLSAQSKELSEVFGRIASETAKPYQQLTAKSLRGGINPGQN